MLNHAAVRGVFGSILIGLMSTASTWAMDLDFWRPLGLQVYENQGGRNERRIAHITSDVMDGATDFLVELGSQGEVVAFRLITTRGAAIEFNLDHLREGAVLKTDEGVGGEVLHTLTLQSDGFDRKSGGDLTLTYLINGAPFMHKYGHFDVRLRPNERRQWTFQSGNRGQPFNALFLKGNHMFGKVVGIASVEVSWDDQIKYLP